MNSIKKFSSVAILFSTIIMTSCSKDDGPTLTDNLIGTWAATEVAIIFTIDGTPLQQWLIDETGATSAEAQELVNAFATEISEDFSAVVEFMSDNTYSATFASEPVETGTWALSADGNTITLTATGSTEVNTFDVVSLTATTLIIGFTETETSDLNDDQVEEELSLSIELTLLKS